MYSINGVALDNKALGWRLLRASMPLPEFANRLISVERGGMDGVTPFRSTRDIMYMTFSLETTTEGLPALLAVFGAHELVVRDEERPGRVAVARLASSTPESYHPVPNRHKYNFLLEVHGSAWRDTTTTTSTKFSFNTSNNEIFSGISAPIQDLLVRFQGPVTNPQVVDSSGAYITVKGTIAANQYVRIHTDIGRAWVTTSDTWTVGSEVSADIDYGGPRGNFEITPSFTTDPTVRTGKFNVTGTSAGAGSGVQFRGKNAYLY